MTEAEREALAADLADDPAWLRELKQLHIWMVRYRALAVMVTTFCCYLLWDAWTFWKAHYQEFVDLDAASGIGPFIIAFLGGVKWSLENVTKRHEGHGE